MRARMLMRVNFLVYRWCWIISSDFHRQFNKKMLLINDTNFSVHELTLHAIIYII